MIPTNVTSDRLRLSDGHEIPRIGFGTYRLTGAPCERMVALALDIGYRHLDTAQIYDNQRAVAQGIKGWPREDLYITSKLWVGDHTREKVPQAFEQILRELQTDYLDLLLIHWPDPQVSCVETLQAMEQLRQAQKVRSLGVSNFTIRHLNEALTAQVPLVTNQVEFHPFFYQKELQDFCEGHGMKITAHTPLARGEVVQSKLLATLGKKYGKSSVQIALRWLLQRDCIIIPKTATPERLQENTELYDFELTSDDLAAIDALHNNQRTVNPPVADFDES